MWIKKHLPYFFTALFLIVLTAAYTLFAASYGENITDGFSALTGIGGKKIIFSGGDRLKVDSEDISVVLQDGETALLDGFTALRFANLSGSNCPGEIMTWAEAHPQVDVRYTVTLPDGRLLDNKTAVADLEGLRHDDVSQAVEQLGYLPELTALDLGSTETSPSLTIDDIAKFAAAFPQTEISYNICILGKEYPVSAEEVDLSGLTGGGVQDTSEKLKMISGLKTVVIGNNATENGELTWEDISRIASAVPEAALDYRFSVLGTEASLSDESIDLHTITAADIPGIVPILKGMTHLKYINAGGEDTGLALSDLAPIFSAAPEAVVDYRMSILGRSFSLADEVLDFNHVIMPDNGALVKSILPYCRNCKRLDMDFCGKGNEFNAAMQSIRDEFPEVEVIWRIWFGENYSVRTNVTKILASKPSKGGKIYNDDAAQLKYCTNVRYLDVGHNSDLSDFSFVSYMPDLEIVVMSMCAVSNLTPFASCSHLKYMEAGNTQISDLTPLKSCTELAHLNIGTCPGVTDLSPLFDLPLKRLWLCTNNGSHCTNYSMEDAARITALHPDCEVNVTCPTGYNNGDDAEGYVKEGWKYWQQYLTNDWNYYGKYGYFPAQRPLGYWKVVYKAFQYNLGESAYAFAWNDPKYDQHDASVQPVNTIVIDTSLLSEDWKEPMDNIVEDVLSDPPGDIVQVFDY